jgi:hypothetical protein
VTLMRAKTTRHRTTRGGVTASAAPEELFWKLAAELRKRDRRIVEGTIMNKLWAQVLREGVAFVPKAVVER